jgi:nucleotide-binding universal stress UspA family protein
LRAHGAPEILDRAMLATVAVGTDGSPTAAQAVKVAAEMAKRFDAELVLLSAFSDSGGGPLDRGGASEELQWSFNSSARLKTLLDRSEADLRAEGVRCSQLVDEGDPGEVLVRLAEECSADVLVIGNKGMQRRVLGSVPNTVTHKAKCSVFVVKTT